MDAVSASAERVAEGRERILGELRKVIVGQDEVVEQVLLALFTGGHCLITGVPGLAKTLLIKTLADILDLDFKRIDRKSTRLNSSHSQISYAVFCLKKKNK